MSALRREAGLEIELLLSGIGGQGVQMVGKTLALAAVSEGRNAQLYGEYGGEMRGGNSLVNVIVGDGPIRALPIVSAASHAIILNMKFWTEVENRIRTDALLVVDKEFAPKLPASFSPTVVPAREIALEAGNAMATGLALLGAFAAATHVVSIDALIAAMKQQVPSYRRQHVETNSRAILMGAAAAASADLSRSEV